ncbi:MAG: transposase [Akkermansia sp.]
MSRPLRIEYPGAVYHIQSIGNKNDDIFQDDTDRELFLKTFEEACTRCHWNAYAYALMNNHYHILFETIDANLVNGMKWLQTTYTMRYNRRHGYQGHVFAGRYKSMLIEVDNAHYFSTIIDYIHLNPARAGLARKQTFLSGSKWTSLPDWIKDKNDRNAWIHPARGLACFGCDDTPQGHDKYMDHLIGRFEAESMDERSLLPAGHVGSGTVQRGWCYGSSAFRQRIIDTIPNMIKRNPGAWGRAGAEIGEHKAETIVTRGLRAFGLTEEELLTTPFSHPSKLIIALAIRQSSMVSYAWLANRLHMGTPRSLGTLLHRAKAMEKADLKTRAWIEKISTPPTLNL